MSNFMIKSSSSASTGFVAFAAVSISCTARLYFSSTAGSARKGTEKEFSALPVNERKIAKMECVIQRDEGKRGILDILPPSGELHQAATLAANASNVCIIGGYPCLMEFSPPTETDGPLGCVAIARALLMAGKSVTIATDECNEEVMIATCAGANLQSFGELFELQSFPPAKDFDEKDVRRFQDLSDSVDLTIALERPGPCADGAYRTMRGYDMTNILAPLELLMTDHIPTVGGDSVCSGPKEVNDNDNGTASATALRKMTIGVGDGGNEVGMAKQWDAIMKSQIMNKELIACTVSADRLIVASVSNWGGYALAAAIGVMLSKGNNDMALSYVPSDEAETLTMMRMVDAGARDAFSKKQEDWVDGMPWSASLGVLAELRAIINSEK